MIALAMMLAAAQDGGIPPSPANLLGETRQSPYSGQDAPKRYEVHDFIRVVVRDRSTALSSADLRTNRQSRFEVELDNWIRLEQDRSAGHFFPEIRAADLAGDPGIDLDARYRNDSRASTGRSFDLQFTIMAEIVEVRPNGTLVIEAVKERTVNSESEIIRLTGEVPAQFITDDTVLSDNVANLRVRYEGSGVVSDTAEPGFLGWILQKLWPF